MEKGLTEFFDRWASYILAGAAAGFAFIWAVKRDSAKISEIERKVHQIERRLEDFDRDLKRAAELRMVEAVTLGRIEEQLKNLASALSDLKSELKQKADKA